MSTESPLSVVLAGGGTAGHIRPLLAIADWKRGWFLPQDWIWPPSAACRFRANLRWTSSGFPAGSPAP